MVSFPYYSHTIPNPIKIMYFFLWILARLFFYHVGHIPNLHCYRKKQPEKWFVVLKSSGWKEPFNSRKKYQNIIHQKKRGSVGSLNCFWLWGLWHHPLLIGSMGLIYLAYLYGKLVGKYTSPMDPSWVMESDNSSSREQKKLLKEICFGPG